MSKIVQISKKNRLLTLVIFLYLALAIFMPDKAILSLKNSLYYVKEMLTIMPVILILTALITAWVPKKAIEKNLGKDSGWKGSVFSFLLGSFSAGPIYAAFPVSKALLKKGASISNIVILLSTWAVVKVPMLLNEAKFLSPRFMAIRWLLTTISIFIMAYITSALVKKEDLPADANYAGEKPANSGYLRLSSQYCTGCGLCVKIAPEYFAMGERKAEIIGQVHQGDCPDTIKAAMAQCPAGIIYLAN